MTAEEFKAEIARRREQRKAQKAERHQRAAEQRQRVATDEYEAETLRLAAAGDVEARRELLALAADAIRRGLSLSDGLRAWLSDALVGLLAAGAGGLTQAQALEAMGLGPRPIGRPARKREDALLRVLSRAAAVHLLTPRAGSRTQAVAWVADAAGCEAMAVWRDLKGGSEWLGTAKQAMRAARPLIRRARALGLLSQTRPHSG